MSPPPNPLLRPPFTWWTPDPLSQDSHPPSSTREIHFLHPGYSYPYNTLFSLPALDRGGVHHGVALTACTIISGNRPGTLSTSASPPNPNPPTQPVLQFDDVLTKDEYYFHPEPAEMLSDSPYPICPDFRSWLFPHRRLPREWADMAMSSPSTNITPTAYNKDHSCRITACSDGITNTHIVPRDEIEWFCFNSMALYNTNHRLCVSELILDSRNTFPLRTDLVSAFDEGKLVFVPKESKPVVHILATTHELTPLYHNRVLHAFTSVNSPPREFLYARFAHSIFPLLAGFFGGGTRRVCTATRSKGRDDLGCVRWETEWIDWGDILRWKAGSGVIAKGVVGGLPIVALGEIVGDEEGEEEEEEGEEGGKGDEV